MACAAMAYRSQGLGCIGSWDRGLNLDALPTWGWRMSWMIARVLALLANPCLALLSKLVVVHDFELCRASQAIPRRLDLDFLHCFEICLRHACVLVAGRVRFRTPGSSVWSGVSCRMVGTLQNTRQQFCCPSSMWSFGLGLRHLWSSWLGAAS